MKNKPFIGVYHPSIILTFLGVFAAIFGIIILFTPNNPFAADPLKVAMCLLVLAGVCDMFDGTVARAFKNRTDLEKEYGVQLDSLADTVAFLVFPICIMIKSVAFNPWSCIAAFMYIFAGITRLAWFNVSEEHGCFHGLPVTFIAILMPIAHVVLRLAKATPDIVGLVFGILLAIVAVLFVTNFKLKKPSIPMRIIIGVLAITAFVLILIL